MAISVFANKFTAVSGNPVMSQLAVSAAPSYWKMKPYARRDLHSSISLGYRVQRNVQRLL